ncbi:MAG TPA: DegV family protein [Chloroflexia bacterium]|nr:DegV family protein [Chloroflexia bacterium]
MPTRPPPVKIVTDSTADIPPAVAAELGITVVPLLVQIGDQVYRDHVDLNGHAFYRLLEATPGVPTTSQPPIGQIEALYRDLTADGADVVSIHVSSGLSGTYSTCALAATSLDLRLGAVRVVDSQALSMCLGWMAVFAARAARDGRSQAEIGDLVDGMLGRVRILGLLDTLEWVQRGGRLGLASAFLGTMLAIKPILHMKEGKAVPMEKVRTKPKAMQRMVELTESFGRLDALAVVHGDAPDEAERLIDLLAGIYPRDQILVSHIGAVLGSHVGPRAVGICCVLART